MIRKKQKVNVDGELTAPEQQTAKGQTIFLVAKYFCVFIYNSKMISYLFFFNEIVSYNSGLNRLFK